MLAKFDSNVYPEFKEIASLLKAAHDFVQKVDACGVASVHLRRYLAVRLRKFFSNSKRIQGLGNAFAAAPGRQKNYIGQILREFGLINSVVRPDLPSAAIVTYDEIISRFPDFESAKRMLGS
jgi:hypothetical protein